MNGSSSMGWVPTGAPRSTFRLDDVWFVTPSLGWAVSGNGVILNTVDGGDTWTLQFPLPFEPDQDLFVYCRSVTFASSDNGWVGTLIPERRLYFTTNGGRSGPDLPDEPGWRLVTDLPPDPKWVCGLYAASESVIYGSGAADPAIGSAAVMKTADGGKTWTATDLRARGQATSLVDNFFFDTERGFVVGGISSDPSPTWETLLPVVLHTEDGGANWQPCNIEGLDSIPVGTWGWSIQFLDDQLGFVSLQNADQAPILRTLDGGSTWSPIFVPDNANLQGVGFLDENRGWVGGWGPDKVEGTSSATTDGGETWQNADEIGVFINRFRFLSRTQPLGYSAGRTIYKLAPG